MSLPNTYKYSYGPEILATTFTLASIGLALNVRFLGKLNGVRDVKIRATYYILRWLFALNIIKCIQLIALGVEHAIRTWQPEPTIQTCAILQLHGRINFLVRVTVAIDCYYLLTFYVYDRYLTVKRPLEIHAIRQCLKYRCFPWILTLFSLIIQTFRIGTIHMTRVPIKQHHAFENGTSLDNITSSTNASREYVCSFEFHAQKNLTYLATFQGLLHVSAHLFILICCAVSIVKYFETRKRFFDMGKSYVVPRVKKNAIGALKQPQPYDADGRNIQMSELQIIFRSAKLIGGGLEDRPGKQFFATAGSGLWKSLSIKLLTSQKSVRLMFQILGFTLLQWPEFVSINWFGFCLSQNPSNTQKFAFEAVNEPRGPCNRNAWHLASFVTSMVPYTVYPIVFVLFDLNLRSLFPEFSKTKHTKGNLPRKA